MTIKKIIKVLIVDDEELAREDLKDVLANFSRFNIIGEASSIDEASYKTKKLNPDLIFLDIHLKGENGFDLLPLIHNQSKIIFVTAYDEYAIRAFKVNALDYILKPVDAVRLIDSIERIDEIHSNIQETLDYNDSIFIMLNNKYDFLKLNEILVVKAAGDYTEILTTGLNKKLCTKMMKEWEKRLPDNHFCRIHRSTIINLDYVEKIGEWFNQSYSVNIRGIEKPFVMSRGYASKLKKNF